ncbi:hypothetical protein D3C86_1659010 [compost metagenome]
MPELLKEFHTGRFNGLNQPTQRSDGRVIGKAQREGRGSVHRSPFQNSQTYSAPSALEVIINMGIVDVLA